ASARELAARGEDKGFGDDASAYGFGERGLVGAGRGQAGAKRQRERHAPVEGGKRAFDGDAEQAADAAEVCARGRIRGFEELDAGGAALIDEGREGGHVAAVHAVRDLFREVVEAPGGDAARREALRGGGCAEELAGLRSEAFAQSAEVAAFAEHLAA